MKKYELRLYLNRSKTMWSTINLGSFSDVGTARKAVIPFLKDCEDVLKFALIEDGEELNGHVVSGGGSIDKIRWVGVPELEKTDVPALCVATHPVSVVIQAQGKTLIDVMRSIEDLVIDVSEGFTQKALTTENVQASLWMDDASWFDLKTHRIETHGD